jgi:hypothetical protein
VRAQRPPHLALKSWGVRLGTNEVSVQGYKPGKEMLERMPPAGEGSRFAPWAQQRLGATETWSIDVQKTTNCAVFQIACFLLPLGLPAPPAALRDICACPPRAIPLDAEVCCRDRGPPLCLGSQRTPRSKDSPRFSIRWSRPLLAASLLPPPKPGNCAQDSLQRQEVNPAPGGGEAARAEMAWPPSGLAPEPGWLWVLQVPLAGVLCSTWWPPKIAWLFRHSVLVI